MNDKLLCPFCNKPLQPTHRIEDEYFCENYDCPQTSITWIGTSSLWKAFADTKKKLDVAVDAIKNATEYLGNQEPLVDVMAMNLHIDLSKALEQITAQEQKMEYQRQYRKRKKQREIYEKYAPLLAEDAKKWFAHKARVHKLLLETCEVDDNKIL